MSVTNRPTRTTAELIALINQRQPDWWPSDFHLRIDRSAEHDWIAIVDSGPDQMDRSVEFALSLGQVVADLRLRNAWSGH
jgi:hypothetical protein